MNGFYIYTRGVLKTHNHNIAIFTQTKNTIEKLLATLNVHLEIGPKVADSNPYRVADDGLLLCYWLVY